MAGVTTDDRIAALANERYPSLTTYRRDGAIDGAIRSGQRVADEILAAAI